ncbi:MAG: squalene/phytoene synthase family protein [Solibacillus sp.]
MNDKALVNDAMRVLKATSRTFYIPIMFLQKDLKLSVGAAYLVMRALDEIEDNEDPSITLDMKYDLLLATQKLLEQDEFDNDAYQAILAPVKDQMPEVTIRMAEWIEVCPEGSRHIIKRYAAEMAGGMGKWAKANWVIKTREDLDDYTYYVAGLVGVMLSDLWEWKHGMVTDRELATDYGRGLQAVNILRNQEEDMDERGVSFVPDGWTRDDLFAYADEKLANGDAYIASLDKRTITMFAKLPLALAHKTLAALKDGREKMTRAEVEATVEEVQNS